MSACFYADCRSDLDVDLRGEHGIVQPRKMLGESVARFPDVARTLLLTPQSSLLKLESSDTEG